MNFTLTEEQNLISSTAEAFLSEHSSSEAVRTAMESESGRNNELWQRICNEMGWQGIHLPESSGGLDLGFSSLVIVLEQSGRFLLCSPFFSSICMTANTMLACADEKQNSDFLKPLCSGVETAAMGWNAPGSRNWDSSAVAATVEKDAEGFRLNGHIANVVDGHQADWLVLAARSPGSKGSEGISLFVVSAEAAGLERRPAPALDLTRRLADIRLDNVYLSGSALLGHWQQSGPALDNALSLSTIALAAEQAGVARRCLETTVSYTTERKQFGRPVGSFQAVKHKCADMMVTVESLRSAVWYAGCVAEDFLAGRRTPEELHQAAGLVGSRCGDGLFQCAADAIQLHGGVGFTWEYDVHMFFKRALSSQQLLGTPAWHRQRLAASVLEREDLL